MTQLLIELVESVVCTEDTVMKLSTHELGDDSVHNLGNSC